MDNALYSSLCETCIDRFKDSCLGYKYQISIINGYCAFYKPKNNEEEKNIKPTNPKDMVGSDKMPFHLCPSTITKIISQQSGHYCSPAVRVAITLPLLEGMLKYGRSNYRVVGVRASIYYDAFYRHINSYMTGEITDKDSGFPHLFKAMACMTVLIEAELANKLNDDRMIKGGYEKLQEQIEIVDSQLNTVCDLLDMWFEGLEINGKNCLRLALGHMAEVIEKEYPNYDELIHQFTPMIKELKEKYKDKNPKHYTIADNEIKI